MRRISGIVLGLLIFGAGVAFADQINAAVKTEADPHVKAGLVAMDSSTNRINQLERRVGSLERDLHSQNDYIRNLERDLNDLRRRT